MHTSSPSCYLLRKLYSWSFGKNGFSKHGDNNVDRCTEGGDGGGGGGGDDDDDDDDGVGK